MLTTLQCCSPELNGGGGWGFFNAILGWTNSATYGSVIAYNVYWIFVIAMFLTLRYHEVKGHWPFMKAKNVAAPSHGESDSQHSGSHAKGGVTEKSMEA